MQANYLSFTFSHCNAVWTVNNSGKAFFTNPFTIFDSFNEKTTFLIPLKKCFLPKKKIKLNK